MANVRAILSATLLVSAAVGTEIVLTDQYLVSAAPSHAYGLVVFVAIDIALAIALLKKFWLGSLLSMALATVQATAMLADVLTYSTPDVPQQAFGSYLLNNPAFIFLLIIQPVILATDLGATDIRTEYSMIRSWIHTNLLR